MSYRQRIGKFPKKLHEQHKNKSVTELTTEFSEDPDYYNVSSPEGFTELLYIPPNNYPNKDKWIEFYNFNCKEESDQEFFIISKENVELIIKYLEKEVYYYFDDLYKNFDNKMNNIASMILQRRSDWNVEFDTNVSLEKDTVIMPSAGAFDYFLINLVAIYKIFDWENDYMIVSGW